MYYNLDFCSTIIMLDNGHYTNQLFSNPNKLCRVRIILCCTI